MTTKKLCSSRSKDHCLWGSHHCGLPQGHTGQHRCRDQMDSKGFKKFKKPIPCNFRWGKKLHSNT